MRLESQLVTSESDLRSGPDGNACLRGDPSPLVVTGSPHAGAVRGPQVDDLDLPALEVDPQVHAGQLPVRVLDLHRPRGAVLHVRVAVRVAADHVVTVQ